MTRDDALKNLNTKIMAGEGPDVLVLDNMPIESYINKGLLLDLSTFAGELNGNGNLFQNVVEAVKTDDKLYAGYSRDAPGGNPRGRYTGILFGEGYHVYAFHELRVFMDNGRGTDRYKCGHGIPETE